MNLFLRRYIGDKRFYHSVLTVAVPMIVQNTITNFVSLLDNIMVGQVGTEQMSGVAIVNQLLFVYNLCIFGGLAGAGIFTAQYFGQGDEEGVRHTFRYKLWLAALLTVLALVLLLCAGTPLIQLYLSGQSDGTDPALALSSGLSYLHVMLWGLVPFMLVQAYTSTLRECSETVLPMKAGIAAVMINLLGNWLLIYGNLGLPRLGVVGAGVATVISRWAEALIVLIWAHTHTHRCRWMKGMYRTLRVPGALVRRFLIKGSPLLLNEGLWSAGQAFLTQCYSVRGLSVIAAMNISSTINNLFTMMFFTIGSSISIVVGQLLGAGRMEEAKDTDRKMIVFAMLIAAGVALVVFLTAPLFPLLYNTTEQTRELAASFMRVAAIFMPQMAFLNATYFTLRSGGKTIITFLFDSVAVWVVSIPIAFVLSRYTGLHVVWINACVQMGDWAKCVLGYILVRRGVWVHNIVEG